MFGITLADIATIAILITVLVRVGQGVALLERIAWRLEHWKDERL
jgi:hypothetical protein